MWYPKILTVSVLVGLVQGKLHNVRDDPSSTTFNWTALPSSDKLSRTPCYDVFQCAKLTVPLQYSDPSAGNADIALVILPSNYSADSPLYRGPILFNPGGPGDQGTTFFMTFASYFRAIIGPAYDLVGFDPRGLEFSAPALSLFSDVAEAAAFASSYPTDVEAGPDAFARSYAWGQILSAMAEQKLQAGEKIWESVGTAAVARDMLAIAKAFGSDELNYWGFSYGTTLGSTFAAMFPEHVGRFILDGVTNSHEYYAGHDRSTLIRAPAALNSVYEGCVAAGPSRCALWSPNATAVRARVDALRASLLTTPLAVPPDAERNITQGGVVDYAALTGALFIMLYSPYLDGPPFMAALAALERGDPAPLYAFTAGLGGTSLPTSCGADAGGMPFQLGYVDTHAPIACGDSAGRAKVRLAEARAEFAVLKDSGGFLAGPWWTMLPTLCTTWNITAKDLYNGSLTATTKNPILLLSNTFDPVAALESARNMSAGFAGSVVLEQNSTGHSSLAGFSTCTALAVRAYFANGTLPAHNTLCQTDTQLFIDPGNSSAPRGITLPGRRAVFERGALGGEEEEREFADAVRALREKGSAHMGRRILDESMPQGTPRRMASKEL